MLSFLKNIYYEQARSLPYAIETKNEKTFRSVLNARGDVNKPITDNGRITPLEYCFLKENYKFAFILLDEFKANPNNRVKSELGSTSKT